MRKDYTLLSRYDDEETKDPKSPANKVESK